VGHTVTGPAHREAEVQQLWVFLHIGFMFASVALSVGGGWFALSAAWRRDVPAIRSYFRFTSRTGLLEGILPLLGIGFGLIAAVSIGWDLLEGWLVLAYVLVGIALVVGGIGGRYAARARAALEADAGDTAGPELEAALAARGLYGWNLASSVLLMLLIWDMVYKPEF
jgi:hypothetical protein